MKRLVRRQRWTIILAVLVLTWLSGGASQVWAGPLYTVLDLGTLGGTAVSEPTSLTLAGLGLLGLAAYGRRCRKQAAA
jgi:MYXO-CTERM domain-containing protein